jgi:hypothetical protein
MYAEDIVEIHYQAAASEDTEDLAYAVVRSKMLRLLRVL